MAVKSPQTSCRVNVDAGRAHHPVVLKQLVTLVPELSETEPHYIIIPNTLLTLPWSRSPEHQLAHKIRGCLEVSTPCSVRVKPS